MNQKSSYKRVWCGGRLVMEHRLVWEAAHGPVPPGHQIHHINENRSDNRLENLQCVDVETHKRIHSGCVQVDDGWVKPCSVCSAMLPVTDDFWYFIQRRGQGRYPTGTICRRCHSARVVQRRSRKRRERGPTERQADRAVFVARAVQRRAAAEETWKQTAAALGWAGTADGLRMLVKAKTQPG